MFLALIFSVLSFGFTVQVDAPDLLRGKLVGLKQEVYVDAMNAFHRIETKNNKYMVIIDFSQPAKSRRLYLIDLLKNTVERHNVAVGAGSDKNSDGIAEAFSNVDNTHMSSLGAYLTRETYFGKHGLSLRLDGMDPTNSKVRARGIVVHAADYVKDGVKAGRSWGCPAVDPAIYKDLITKIKGGALLYIGK